MAFKLNISNKGKAWKLEVESEFLVGKSIGEKFNGKEINPDLEGYELEITGGSDKAGFPMYKEIEGIGLKRVLLTKGWGMHKRPKGDKKKVPQPKGLRLRKSVRGRTISDLIVQINLRVLTEGKKKLEEIFPDQNKAPEPETKEEPKVKEQKETPKPEENKTEAPAEEVKTEEKKENEAK